MSVFLVVVLTAQIACSRDKNVVCRVFLIITLAVREIYDRALSLSFSFLPLKLPIHFLLILLTYGYISRAVFVLTLKHSRKQALMGSA